MIINNFLYNNNTQPQFSGLVFRKPHRLKLFNEVCCSSPSTKYSLNKNNKDYFVRIEEGYTDNSLHIKIDDNDFNEVGSSTLTILNDGKTIYNDNIDVISSQMRNSGAGSIMTLGELITMLENNIDKIELHSLGQAVFFHSKFKFKPALNNIEDLKDYIIGDILMHSQDNRFSKVCTLAKKWLYKKDSSAQYIEEGNNILYEYLQTVNKNKLNKNKEFEIYPGFDMVLTRKHVLDNKDYFNKLFKMFGFDYQINDSFC